MTFKFEKLEVWKLSLAYSDQIYRISEELPKQEDYNLKQQIRRAAVSISLNIAEGSTGQSDPEQARFLGLAIRSLVETIACLRIIESRNYLDEKGLRDINQQAEQLARKLQAFRNTLRSNTHHVSEESGEYDV
jgi:four helix bundle protein